MSPADAQSMQGPPRQRTALCSHGALSLQREARQPTSLNPAHNAWARQTEPSWQPSPGPQAATVRLHPHAYVLHQSSCFFQAALQNWRGTFLVCVIPLCYRGRSLCFALQSQALMDSILYVLRPKDKKEIYEIIKI